MTGSPMQPCFVIHRRDYRNSSLLLELFTPGEGRMAAIARGAKSGRALRAALLQPFRPLLVVLSGRGEVKTLGQVEAEGRAFALSGRALYCGFYLNELLMRLVQRTDPHPDLFVRYIEALEGLAAGRQLENCLRSFEIDLLKELGYEMVLDQETRMGQPVMPEQCYEYILEQGPVLAQAGSSARLIHGRTLLDLHNKTAMEAASLAEARGLMRRVLAFYLGDKPLKSRELFRNFKQTGD